MSKYISLLLLLYSKDTGILRVALKLDRDKLPSDFQEAYYEYTDILQDKLPLHCQGFEIVEIDFIFEIEDRSKCNDNKSNSTL